jgi:hypothetical protein
MKSERLNKAIKEKLASQLILNKYSWKRKALIAKGKLIADQVYDTVFSSADRLAFLSAPKHYFRKASCMNFYVGGENHTAQFNGESHILRGGLPNRTFGSSNTWGPHVTSVLKPMPFLAPNDKFKALSFIGLEVTQHLVNLESFRSDCNSDYSLAMRALNEFKTSKQLEEGWPAVMKFYPIGKDEIQLPAVQLKLLNVQLGLI